MHTVDWVVAFELNSILFLFCNSTFEFSRLNSILPQLKRPLHILYLPYISNSLLKLRIINIFAFSKRKKHNFLINRSGERSIQIKHRFHFEMSRCCTFLRRCKWIFGTNSSLVSRNWRYQPVNDAMDFHGKYARAKWAKHRFVSIAFGRNCCWRIFCVLSNENNNNGKE